MKKRYLFLLALFFCLSVLIQGQEALAYEPPEITLPEEPPYPAGIAETDALEFEEGKGYYLQTKNGKYVGIYRYLNTFPCLLNPYMVTAKTNGSPILHYEENTYILTDDMAYAMDGFFRVGPVMLDKETLHILSYADGRELFSYVWSSEENAFQVVPGSVKDPEAWIENGPFDKYYVGESWLGNKGQLFTGLVTIPDHDYEKQYFFTEDGRLSRTMTLSDSYDDTDNYYLPDAETGEIKLEVSISGDDVTLYRDNEPLNGWVSLKIYAPTSQKEITNWKDFYNQSNSSFLIERRFSRKEHPQFTYLPIRIYAENGKTLNGLQKIDGKYYYFDKLGRALLGRSLGQIIQDNTITDYVCDVKTGEVQAILHYLFEEGKTTLTASKADGQPYTGWLKTECLGLQMPGTPSEIKIKARRSPLHPGSMDGRLLAELKNQVYYFDESGTALKDFQTLEGKETGFRYNPFYLVQYRPSPLILSENLMEEDSPELTENEKRIEIAKQGYYPLLFTQAKNTLTSMGVSWPETFQDVEELFTFIENLPVYAFDEDSTLVKGRRIMNLPVYDDNLPGPIASSYEQEDPKPENSFTEVLIFADEKTGRVDWMFNDWLMEAKREGFLEDFWKDRYQWLTLKREDETNPLPGKYLWSAGGDTSLIAWTALRRLAMFDESEAIEKTYSMLTDLVFVDGKAFYYDKLGRPFKGEFVKPFYLSTAVYGIPSNPQPWEMSYPKVETSSKYPHPPYMPGETSPLLTLIEGKDQTFITDPKTGEIKLVLIRLEEGEFAFQFKKAPNPIAAPTAMKEEESEDEEMTIFPCFLYPKNMEELVSEPEGREQMEHFHGMLDLFTGTVETKNGPRTYINGELQQSGWMEKDQEKYYLDDDGSYHTGWLNIGPNTWYFRPSGTMVTGWQYIDGYWRYFRASGTMVKSRWEWLGKKWKFFNYRGESIDQFWVENGKTWLSQPGPNTDYAKGWKTVEGRTYYFRMTSGTRVSGWQYIDGGWKYFRPQGTQAFGWQYIGGNWYFLRMGSGNRVTGRQYIDGRWYQFRENGTLIGKR